MRKFLWFACALSCFATVAAARPADDPQVTQTVAQGDQLFAQRNYDQALQLYKKADKLAHHTSVVAYMRMFLVEHKTGNLQAALDDTKKAASVPSADKNLLAKAHLARGLVLEEMSSKPSDKKLKESEEENREALSIDPSISVSHFNLGVVLIKEERDADGIAELNAYIASPDADPKTVNEARRAIANPRLIREPLAPGFSFTSLEGRPISNDTLRGKVVVLDFWATWCPSCLEALPSFQDLHKRYLDKSDVIFVSVSGDDNEARWKNFIQKNRMEWTQYIDMNRRVSDSFNVRAIPTYVVLDRDGVIRFHQTGYDPSSTDYGITEAVNKALKTAVTPALAHVTSSAGASSDSAPTAAASAELASGAPARTAIAKDTLTPAPSRPVPSAMLAAGSVSAGVYQNSRLGITFEFPRGWTPMSTDRLASITADGEKMEAAQQQKDLFSAEPVFYASSQAQGDALNTVPSSVTISAAEWSGEQNLDWVRTITQSMAKFGMLVARATQESTISGHTVFQTTFLGQRIWEDQIMSFNNEYVIIIQITAPTKDDLDALSASFQSLTFAKP